MEIKPVAIIRTPFTRKFGIPRQSSLEDASRGVIEFEKDFRRPEALKGLEGFDYIWLIWEFSENGAKWEPCVRPPRLGGNVRMGVWATRSTFRPNALALSCVRIETIDTKNCTITVRGADLMDGTPIYDIKPYIPYADSRPDARAGWTDSLPERLLEVEFAPEVLEDGSPLCDEALRTEIAGILRLDPRPSYHDDPERIYGLDYAGLKISFRVRGTRLTVLDCRII